MQPNQSVSSESGPRAPAHPFTQFFHWIFKVVAGGFFIFCTIMSTNFVINFVVLTLLLAADFWTVKNVTGRLLVGLRWWNESSEDGATNAWKFEALEAGQRQINQSDSVVFWWSQTGAMVFWLLMIIVEIFRFKLTYLLVVILALFFTGANLYGYYKCTSWAKKNKLRDAANQGMFQAMTGSMASMFTRV